MVDEAPRQREKPVAVGFARRLKACRSAAGISQESLAILAGLHRTEASLLERGLREPKLETLVKVAGVLDLTLGELIGETRWSVEDGFEFGEGADE